jgi:hypothetical protein
MGCSLWVFVMYASGSLEGSIMCGSLVGVTMGAVTVVNGVTGESL